MPQLPNDVHLAALASRKPSGTTDPGSVPASWVSTSGYSEMGSLNTVSDGPDKPSRPRTPRTPKSLLRGITPPSQDPITGASTSPSVAPITLTPPSMATKASDAEPITSNKAVIAASAAAIDETYNDLAEAAKKRRLALVDSANLPDLSPAEVLLIDIRRTHVLVNEMARRISPILASLPDPSALDPNDRDYDVKLRDTYNAFLGVTAQGSKPHAFLQLLLNFQKHLTAVAKAALDADVADRMAAVAEADAMDVLEVMKNIFNDDELSLTTAQRRTLPVVIRRHVETFRKKRSLRRHGSMSITG